MTMLMLYLEKKKKVIMTKKNSHYFQIQFDVQIYTLYISLLSPESLLSSPVFYWGFMLLNFCVVFCGPLFIFLSLFCWSLYCLYFNLPLLINPIDIFINCSYMLSFFVISTNSLKTHIASCEICNKYWKWDIVLHKKYPTQT